MFADGDDIGDADPHDAPDAEAVPLPDPIVLAEPRWEVGIERAEIATRGSSICYLCSASINRGHCRLKHWQNKSSSRFVHPACVHLIPMDHKPHSRARLTWQRSFGVGHDYVVVVECIDEALALLE